MAPRKKATPIITHSEILAIAGGSIQAEIIKWRKEFTVFAEKAVAKGAQDMVAAFRSDTNRQIAYHMARLEAIETMYQIETGVELGYIAEITQEDGI